MVKLGDKIKYRNLNTGTIQEGFIQSEIKDKNIIGIGMHNLSWFKKTEIEVLERYDYRMQRFFGKDKEVL